MHSRCEKYYFLVTFKFEGPSFWVLNRFREYSLGLRISGYLLSFVSDAVHRRNCDELHFPALDGVVDGFSIEVDVGSLGEGVLYLIHLVHGIFVAEGGREGEVGGFIGSMVEHVGELENELVLLEEVVDFVVDPLPRGLRSRQHSEHWLQPIAIQLGLVVQILEYESQLLTLRDTMHREVKPSLVPFLLVGSAVIGHPQEELVAHIAPSHLSQVS
jgi:hypothetical protein